MGRARGKTHAQSGGFAEMFGSRRGSPGRSDSPQDLYWRQIAANAVQVESELGVLDGRRADDRFLLGTVEGDGNEISYGLVGAYSGLAALKDDAMRAAPEVGGAHVRRFIVDLSDEGWVGRLDAYSDGRLDVGDTIPGGLGPGLDRRLMDTYDPEVGERALSEHAAELCRFCESRVGADYHLHQGHVVCDGCWDERLAATA